MLNSQVWHASLHQAPTVPRCTTNRRPTRARIAVIRRAYNEQEGWVVLDIDKGRMALHKASSLAARWPSHPSLLLTEALHRIHVLKIFLSVWCAGNCARSCAGTLHVQHNVAAQKLVPALAKKHVLNWYRRDVTCVKTMHILMHSRRQGQAPPPPPPPPPPLQTDNAVSNMVA